MTICPCGSGNTYSECCEQIISGSRPATTAEQLMRARYSAYVFAQMDFVFESTHPDHRQVRSRRHQRVGRNGRMAGA